MRDIADAVEAQSITWDMVKGARFVAFGKHTPRAAPTYLQGSPLDLGVVAEVLVTDDGSPYAERLMSARYWALYAGFVVQRLSEDERAKFAAALRAMTDAVEGDAPFHRMPKEVRRVCEAFGITEGFCGKLFR